MLLILKSKEVNIDLISSLGISWPISLFVLSKFKSMDTSSGFLANSSIISLEIFPSHNSQIKIAALLSA